MAEMRTYEESSWAVRRWDWFHHGTIIEPKSFCQFWRTVVVYATLAQFLPFLREKTLTPQEWFESRNRPRRNYGHAFRPLLILLAPVRFLASIIAAPFLLTAVWIDEHDQARERIIKVLRGLVAGIAISALIGIALFLSWFAATIVIPWLLGGNVALFFAEVLAAGMVGFGVFIGLILLVAYALEHGGENALAFVGSGFHLAWDIAVTEKKRVCPPMEIRRQWSYSPQLRRTPDISI